MKLNRTIGNVASAAVIIASLSACSTMNKMKDGVTDAAGAAADAVTGTSEEDSMLAEKSKMLETREAELAKRSAELDKRESMIASAAQTPKPAGNNYGAGDLLPPDAKPGQCFTRLWVPPQYETLTERMLVEEEAERVEIIPAKYQTVKQRVLVKEASEKLVAVPATYKTVKERVLVKAATRKLEQVDAVYEDVTQRVVDKPAHTTWKKGTGPIQRIDETTGEIMCLVEVPATYKTVKKRVLKKPASTKVVEIPAEYNTIEKRVIATPPATRKIAVPAEYKTVNVTKEVTPAKERRIKVPAKYATVTKRKLVKDGMMDWREILCETNMTRSRITQIQQSLKKAGYNPGNIDGVIGQATMKAVNAFQRAKGLPVDRYLNIATVKALGVAPK
jgi:hypothetical protein